LFAEVNDKPLRPYSLNHFSLGQRITWEASTWVRLIHKGPRLHPGISAHLSRQKFYRALQQDSPANTVFLAPKPESFTEAIWLTSGKAH
jgi:hypothetical protein